MAGKLGESVDTVEQLRGLLPREADAAPLHQVMLCGPTCGQSIVQEMWGGRDPWAIIARCALRWWRTNVRHKGQALRLLTREQQRTRFCCKKG